MTRIRTDAERKAEQRAWLGRVAKALNESEPAEAAKVIIGLHVGDNGQLPRIPVIGFEAGAIRGTIPHRSKDLLHWRRR